MHQIFLDFIKDKKTITIIQAENPDGDSLGASLALDYLLEDRQISLYCPVNLPKYLHYYTDWSRVSSDFDYHSDGYIIVDTAAEVLLSKTFSDPVAKNILFSKPVLVIDHHKTPDDLSFPHQSIITESPSCCDLIYKIAKSANLEIKKPCAEYLFQGISSDTLGLTANSVNSETFRIAADLIDLGVNVAELEERRREFMKKSPRILDYKADLIKRVDYFLDGKLATVHIPWDDIKEYSDEYNPNVLILEELRMVEGVELAIAIKSYPDGKVTGKIRSTIPIADQIAGFFGGGGHPFAAGFRTYDTDYETVIKELIDAIGKVNHEAI